MKKKKLKWMGGKMGLSISESTDKSAIRSLIETLRVRSIPQSLVRIGSDADGGYLVPDDLAGITACYSPGVDFNASFESDLYEKYSIGSHLADRSVDAPPADARFLSFTKKHIGAVDDHHLITMESWVQSTSRNGICGDLLLQMDIEGAEYVSVLRMSDHLLSRFRIIVIEIHDVESWRHPQFFAVVSAFFDHLLRHFWVVHNHPNNCCGLIDLCGITAPRVFELTLLRKDRCEPEGYSLRFPHPLDRPNIARRKDLVLPQDWM
jgi:hypothetical protein